MLLISLLLKLRTNISHFNKIYINQKYENTFLSNLYANDPFSGLFNTNLSTAIPKIYRK